MADSVVLASNSCVSRLDAIWYTPLKELGLAPRCTALRLYPKSSDTLRATTLNTGPDFLGVKGGLKVSFGIVKWYRSSDGTDFESFEKAGPERRVMVHIPYRDHSRVW